MKKILIIMLSLGLAVGASAQRFGHGGGGVYYRPHVFVSAGLYSPFYPFYSPFYYPYPGYGYGYRPTKLDMQVQDIKADYEDKIWSVKHDTSLTRKERRQKVHDLRVDRDKDIDAAKRNYYKSY